VLRGDVAPGVQLILGTNSDEGTSFIGYNRTGDDPSPPGYHATEADFRRW
jgi:hypothetical protein